MYKIIVDVKESHKRIFLLEENTLVEKYEAFEDSCAGTDKMEGNIYIGKVQNVLLGMQAAFVDIGEDKNAFIHLKDLIPKQDIRKVPLEDFNGDINKILKPGMPLLVQIKKDNINKKGAKITTHFNLAGRFVVYTPNCKFIAVSQKIENENERERLSNIVKKLLPENSGAIIRTSAFGKLESEIKEDLIELINVWDEIEKEDMSDFPRLVYKSNSILEKLLIDLIDKGIDAIFVNNKKEYNEICEFIKRFNNGVKVELKDDALECYGIETKLCKLEDRKIWLNCGGYISIDKTEALTTIDINSSKYVGKGDLEETAFNVNREASVEIARSIRFQNISGIIIIDYINMKRQENKDKIEELLKACLKKDRSVVQVMGFTKLNLMEMTRKHLY